MPTPRSVGCVALLLAGCATTPDSTTTSAAWTCSSRLELSQVWSFLEGKYDRNHDARITTVEYTRGATRFKNFDRDDNGVLEAADFPEDTFFNGFTHLILRQADRNHDNQVTGNEWAMFGKRLDDNGDGQMTADEVANVLGSWASDWRLFLLSFDQDGDGKFSPRDLDLAFRDQDFDGNGSLSGKEMSGWQPVAEDRGDAPAPGTQAPDFELPLAGNAPQTWRLHGAIKTQPVALIFGSYT